MNIWLGRVFVSTDEILSECFVLCVDVRVRVWGGCEEGGR